VLSLRVGVKDLRLIGTRIIAIDDNEEQKVHSKNKEAMERKHVGQEK
jgi:hypothetical protein